jgi:hypothetical protein
MTIIKSAILHKRVIKVSTIGHIGREIKNLELLEWEPQVF